MLRILYYLCTKSGKINTKKGVGLYYVMGVYYVFYGTSFHDNYICFVISNIQTWQTIFGDTPCMD